MPQIDVDVDVDVPSAGDRQGWAAEGQEPTSSSCPAFPTGKHREGRPRLIDEKMLDKVKKWFTGHYDHRVLKPRRYYQTLQIRMFYNNPLLRTRSTRFP